jgi:glutamine amidotransferase
MNVVIIKYNAGNIMSVDYAMRRLAITPQVTDDHELIRAADRVIFPGVGEASTTMQYLREKRLDQLIPDLKQPVLGICLGLQLMCNASEEGNTACLGIFNETVRKFKPPPAQTDPVKVPHMGWNTLYALRSPLFSGIAERTYTYFVHSYYVPAGPETIARCDYITPISAALQRNNFYGTQFHPEKSGKPGSQILKNFLEL